MPDPNKIYLSAMNELDKLSPSGDDLNRVDAEAIAEAASEACECAERDNVCAEETSPSLDIAAVADQAEGEKEEPVRNYHSMTKEEMVDALKEIVAAGDMEAHKDVAALKQAFYILHNKQLAEELDAFVSAGNSPETFSATPDENEAVFKTLLADFREKRNAFLEEKEEARRKNLEEKNRIIEELKTLAEDIDNINVHFPKFQQLQQDFKAVGEVPAGADNDIWKAYQSVVELFYDRLKMNKELRDLDFKKNLELKNALIEKAKELTEEPDPIDAFKRLQTLHEQWREIGPVAREIREEIWSQFKELSTVINKRHQDFFQARKASEQANEDAKTALCEKAEAVDMASLKSFADWDKVTKEIIEM